MRLLFCCAAVATVIGLVAHHGVAHSQDPSPSIAPSASTGVLQFTFVPTDRAQLALWLERGDGEFLQTLRLTEAVSYRGIGNRPGASQMNSGFRWPYGRREGALPVWAHARASAPGAELWKRVIFQDRNAEGLASRTSDDFSVDDYYCLSFDRTRSSKDALDAVSCATIFSSDKGRFLDEDDVAAGYAEPFEGVDDGVGRMRPLSLYSVYPPRRDARHCGENCLDHEDVKRFASHAREVMPDIDAVTMATPVGDESQRIVFAVPSDWEDGDYRACLEVNVEGDYNAAFNDSAYPTPTTPIEGWDSWAMSYGYAFRGQPSVVYCLDFELGGSEEQVFATDEPSGSVGTWDIDSQEYGQLRGMEGMTDDPSGAPGSGADRLRRMDDGERFRVLVRPPLSCDDNQTPGQIEDLALGRHGDARNAHQWAELSFRAADDDDGVYRYEVRVSTDPITDEDSFMAAQPAKNATVEAEELRVPTNAPAGEMISTEMGGLVQQQHYFVGVRAVDGCAQNGAIAVAEITMPQREFATVTPCFVATAAFGTPFASEVSVLRRVRDRHLMTNALGRAVVAGYYRHGPAAAEVIADHPGLRSAARWALAPFVWLASWLDD